MISYKQTRYYSNKHIQMEITQTANHSQHQLNKYSGVPWKQHSLLKSNAIFREIPGSVVIT